jgi:hypothetical protein
MGNQKDSIEDLLDFCDKKSQMTNGKELAEVLIGRLCTSIDDEWDLTEAIKQLLKQELTRCREKHGITSQVTENVVEHKAMLGKELRHSDPELKSWSALWIRYVCHVPVEEISSQIGLEKRRIQQILQQARNVYLAQKIRELKQRNAPFITPPRDESPPQKFPSKPPIALPTSISIQATLFPGSRTTVKLPPRPQLLIGRDDDLQNLKSRLGIDQGDTTEHIQVLTAMRGWPGVGKTTLAAAMVYDKDILRTFPDGILWASLGEEPNIFAELQSWNATLGLPQPRSPSIEELSFQIRARLANQRWLLIVDDAWKAEHTIPFKVAGPGCALLVTTRLPEVAREIVAIPNHIYLLGVLTDEKGLELLRTLAPTVVAENEEASMKLVRALEGLPLALQVAGRWLQAEVSYHFKVTDLLEELKEGVKLLGRQPPLDMKQSDSDNDVPQTVTALLQKSTQRLDPLTLDCFAYLGPFAPKPATFSEAAMQSVWKVEDPKPIIRTLVERGLLEPSGEERYWMHALLVAHAKSLLT